MLRNTHSVNKSSVQTLYTYYCIDNVVMVERDFPHTSRPTVRPTQSPAKQEPGSFLRVNWPGRGVDHPANSSAEVKEREELYLYCPLSLKSRF
jgi:hypothetical protein